MTDDEVDGNRDDIFWRGGVPVSRRFGDAYFAAGDGIGGGADETLHVFLKGNDLPARWADLPRRGARFHIAELGFGTGLNFLVARRLWRQVARERNLQDARLTYTSFELWPLGRERLAEILSHLSDSESGLDAADLIAAWPISDERRELGGCALEVICGDARHTLPAWGGRADAWFLDGFAPAKNPELWGAALMEQVALHTAPGGTFATYTAAGRVRRRLEEAGFAVSRTPGFGRKRHMSRGCLRLKNSGLG